jgi:hypothetical protein
LIAFNHIWLRCFSITMMTQPYPQCLIDGYAGNADDFVCDTGEYAFFVWA